MSKCVNIKHSPRWVETLLLGIESFTLDSSLHNTLDHAYTQVLLPPPPPPPNSVAQPIRYKLTFSGNNMILIHCPLTAGTQFTDIGDKMKTTLTGC